jgi:acetoacetyl-CoA synthetase
MPLWTPSEERKRDANITRFLYNINTRYGVSLHSYSELYQWSIENIPDFWETVWDFAEIKASNPFDQVVDDLMKFPGAKWFPGARLNFAENLLRYRDDQMALAFLFKGEAQISKYMTYAELYDAVARLARSLRDAGIGVGDRVVGYMPNLIETAVAMLAATSLGAT